MTCPKRICLFLPALHTTPLPSSSHNWPTVHTGAQAPQLKITSNLSFLAAKMIFIPAPTFPGQPQRPASDSCTASWLLCFCSYSTVCSSH